MGKKTKTGKARKDKYYHLAKETGLRSRAAFKLLQLNRKFQFLEKSRVCIDLCAAPGGWLQVAHQNMPTSSFILGVDLVPIKPIPNVATFQEDITTDKCRQTLRKELQTWKADVVLHDGAPNLGMNWLHDAFQQAQLTLMALKLATDFLKKGGWFVSKVFRSKDYHALLWVFKQLFRSVHATKPQASRNESAEIFVVCQNYKAPDKIDPKFLDVRHVFKDVVEPKKGLNLIHPEKIRKRAEGYDETDTSFHHKLLATKFLEAENHTELLSQSHEIVLDTKELKNHPFTTKEIRECCKDIKVLGKKDLRLLINWRKKLKKEQDEMKKKEKPSDMEVDAAETDSEQEDREIEQKLSEVQAEQTLDVKRKRKKVMKEKRKLRDKMELKMVHPGDIIETGDDVDLFNMKKMKSKHGLEEVGKEDVIHEEPCSESDADEPTGRSKKLMESYSRHDEEEEGSDDEEQEKVDDEAPDEDSEAEQDLPEAEENPLIVELENRSTRAKKKTDMWFCKDMFSGLEAEGDEDMEIERMADEYRKKGGVVIDTSTETTKRKRKYSEDSGHVSNDDSQTSDSDDESDDLGSDYDVHTSLQQNIAAQRKGQKDEKKMRKSGQKDGFEVVPAGQPVGKVIKLDPVEMAIGEELIRSSKSRRDMEELSYNRYTFGDEDLPDWFAKEESKHSRKQLPITKEQIDFYKQRLNSINTRPIKKIAEAKARKKRKMTKKLERARKKAESVSDTVEMSDGEKWRQIKDIYKKAGLLRQKKKEVTYVVAKKGGGKKSVRPTGVKGFYKQVDPRMKTDKRQEKRKQDKAKGKGKKSGHARVRR